MGVYEHDESNVGLAVAYHPLNTRRKVILDITHYGAVNLVEGTIGDEFFVDFARSLEKQLSLEMGKNLTGLDIEIEKDEEGLVIARRLIGYKRGDGIDGENTFIKLLLQDEEDNWFIADEADVELKKAYDRTRTNQEIEVDITTHPSVDLTGKGAVDGHFILDIDKTLGVKKPFGLNLGDKNLSLSNLKVVIQKNENGEPVEYKFIGTKWKEGNRVTYISYLEKNRLDEWVTTSEVIVNTRKKIFQALEPNNKRFLTIIDVSGYEPIEYKGIVPERSVVIPGSFSKSFPAGSYNVPCSLIIGKRKASTDLKTSLNDALREYNVAV